MQSVPNVRDEIKVADVVVSTNHVIFLTNRLPRLISLPTSAIFISGTSGITAILKYRSKSYTVTNNQVSGPYLGHFVGQLENN